MHRILSTTLIAALCTVGVAAQAQDKTRSAPSGQEKPGGATSATPMGTGATGERNPMDLNGDGYVSREEYMKYHEGAWGKMKKNNKGMVMSSDIPGMPKIGDAQPNANPK